MARAHPPFTHENGPRIGQAESEWFNGFYNIRIYNDQDIESIGGDIRRS